MRKAPIAVLAVSLAFVGCAGPGDVDVIDAAEAQKVQRVEVGMTIQQVQSIMGTDQIVFNAYSPQASVTPRPARVDKFATKEGKAVTIFYYRTHSRRADGHTTDDETTAVVFLDGKVDAVVPGESSKQVIEVRFR